MIIRRSPMGADVDVTASRINRRLYDHGLQMTVGVTDSGWTRLTPFVNIKADGFYCCYHRLTAVVLRIAANSCDY